MWCNLNCNTQYQQFCKTFDTHSFTIVKLHTKPQRALDFDKQQRNDQRSALLERCMSSTYVSATNTQQLCPDTE